MQTKTEPLLKTPISEHAHERRHLASQRFVYFSKTTLLKPTKGYDVFRVAIHQRVNGNFGRITIEAWYEGDRVAKWVRLSFASQEWKNALGFFITAVSSHCLTLQKSVQASDDCKDL